MTLGVMLTWLLRRVQDEWTVAELTEMLSQGALTVGNLVQAIDPNYFQRRRLQNVASGTRFYPCPPESKTIHLVSLKNTTTGGYMPLEKKPRRIVQDRYSTSSGVSQTQAVVWYRFGRYIALDPIPSAAITDGLEILESYAPTMPADSGASPPHPLELHQAILNRAHRLILPETGDFAALADALDKEYQAMVSEWRAGHSPDGEPTQLSVDDPGYFAEG